MHCSNVHKIFNIDQYLMKPYGLNYQEHQMIMQL